METKIYEVAKEYIAWPEGLSFTVHGRICKDDVGKYRWEISHYYRPSEKAAGTWNPSKRTYDTFEDTERALLLYMGSFTNLDVTHNKYY